MKKLCVAVFVLVLAAVVVAGQAPTSPPAQESSRGDSQFRLSVDRVPVLFTALDQKDRFVKDLTREEVNVFDSKKKQQIKRASDKVRFDGGINLLFHWVLSSFEF